MKKIVTVDEREGFESLLGEEVMVFCVNYIYAGVLTGVNETCVLLEKASIVYETGPFTESEYKDAQGLPGEKWYVQKSAIESFGRGKG